MSARLNNAFLLGLSDEGYRELSIHLKPVELKLGQVVHEQWTQIEWVYFPETALFSTICEARDGRGVETCMIGNEGVSGIPQACGTRQVHFKSVIQVDGKAYRAPAAAVRELCLGHAETCQRAWASVECQLAENRQSIMCRALHEVEQRLARWLLEARERAAGRNPLPLTQEFLSYMLGVQRTTVTLAATALKNRGAIRYSRGQIAIVDTAALLNISCECHLAFQQVRKAFGFSSPTEGLSSDLPQKARIAS